jgi:hypothetical protein
VNILALTRRITEGEIMGNRKLKPIKTNFPPSCITPTVGMGADDYNHLEQDAYKDEVMEAIEDAWNPELIPLRHHKEINLKWYKSFLKLEYVLAKLHVIDNDYSFLRRVKHFFEAINYITKNVFLLLRMSNLEKDLYLNGHGWTPQYFFMMKKAAKRLEKEGRIVVRGEM